MSSKKTKIKQSLSLKQKVIRFVVILFVVTGFFFSGEYFYRCFVEKVCNNEMFDKIVRHDVTVLLPKGALMAEVVSTDKSRSLGLSGREKMKDNEGMLFVFDHPGKYGFWMKAMNFPLDIIWIDYTGTVVWIERNVTPDTYPKHFINGIDASFVLEINAGLSDDYGIYLGSKIKFEN
ncbi:MAG: hypothetical protein RI935_373 [Candidatus Parcubacteria bacterium]|jgi:uncharacterized membrane protein (UPF0127 family)